MAIPSYPTRLVLTAPPPSVEDSLKREVMTYFHHVCACPGCGETRLSELELDHKRGGGNLERKRLKRQGSSFYREVKAAMDRSAPTDLTWLATLQALCRRCNGPTGKGTKSSCALHPVPDENNEASQDDTETVPATESTELPSSNDDLAEEKQVKLDTRIPVSVMKYLDGLGCRNRGAAVTQVVQACQNGEPTVLKTLRLMHREIMTALSARPSTPSSAATTVPSARPPYEDPAQLAAFTIWKREVWDPQHPDPAFPVFTMAVRDTPKRTLWTRLFGGP